MIPIRDLWPLLATVFNLLANVELTTGVSVMSIDIGSEWMKVAIVSPGVPMEIALNKESKRKTPAFISFRNGERAFGEDAQTVGVRFPSNGYGYLLDLLGKKLDNPIVDLYRKRFPYYSIQSDPDRGTIYFDHDVAVTFTPEELMGMLLYKAKEFAEESAGQTVTDAVIVVPGFFNQAERTAMLNAAKLAGLKVLQLINDYTAVALNYGIFRRKDFNESAQYIMFYDMGASSTTATLVNYQQVKLKDSGVVESHPQASILGVGFDRTLGGLEIQIRLQQHLAKKFTEVKKTKSNVYESPRSMAKLFKEAGRVKNVLSANAEHYAQIEGLLDEEDFRVRVTREELESLCQDLFERVGDPIKQALDNAGVTMDIVNQFILVGSGTRVPKIQEILSDIVKMELGKNINADEAAVMGAAYKAADIGTGFRVKKFITKDAVIFPIQVSYKRETETGELKQQKRTLFGSMNAYPQKKMITFNKFSKDFDFIVHYGELDHLSPREIAALGPLNLTQVSLSGVEEAVNKHSGPQTDPKGIKAHFLMDDSGLLKLVNVDYVVERTGEPSTLERIGSGLSKLFGGKSKEQGDNDEETREETENVNGDGQSDKKQEEAVNATEVKNQTVEEKGGEKNETTVKKVKVTVVKEEIPTAVLELGVKNWTEEQFEDVFKKVDKLNELDALKAKMEKSRNALESSVFEAQNRLDVEQYQNAATDEEKSSIEKACSEISAWLEDEGWNAEASVYDEKLTQLKSLTGPWYRRVKEHEDRPEAIKILNDRLDNAQKFLATVTEKQKEAESAGQEVIFTLVELEALSKLINETGEWKIKSEEEQNALPLSATPVLTLRLIAEKVAALDREVNYLINKAKIWRPTKKLNETNAESENKTGNATSSSPDHEDEKPKEEQIVVENEENTEEAEQFQTEDENIVQTEEEAHEEL